MKTKPLRHAVYFNIFVCVFVICIVKAEIFAVTLSVIYQASAEEILTGCASVAIFQHLMVYSYVRRLERLKRDEAPEQDSSS